MKKCFLIMVMVGLAFAACKKDAEPYKFKETVEPLILDFVERPNSKYSVAEVVRNPYVAMLFRYESAGSEDVYCKHFAHESHDTINNRLLMQSSDILTEDGRLVYDFIGARDVYLAFVDYTKGGDNTNINGDTVGYVPQSAIDNARVQIEELYAQEQYDEIYEVFRKAFTFYTCTGEEYKQIVANGGN